MNRRLGWLVVGVVAGLMLLSQVALLAAQYVDVSVIGVDFPPLRHAAQALLFSHSVYSDPTFVYPPSAAPLFLPLTLGSEQEAYSVWVAFGVVLVAVAGCLVGRAAGRHRLVVGVVASYLLLTSAGAIKAFDVGNLSMALASLCAAIVLAFHRQRWLTGCTLLALSLLIKPLLLPLLVVPLVRRRWTDLLKGFAPATAALVIAMLTVPGGLEIGRFVGYVVDGTNLHGDNAVNNLSLAGWAEVHRVSTPVVDTAIVVILALAFSAGWLATRRPHGPLAVQLATLAFVTVLLSGRISEQHFLLPLLVLVLARLVVAPSTRAAVCFVPFVLMSCIQPDSVNVPSSDGFNSWYVGLELFALVGCVTDAVWSYLTGPARDPRNAAMAVAIPAAPDGLQTAIPAAAL